jgi:hypothetical protein
MRAANHMNRALFFVLLIVAPAFCADNLKVVLLDSKDGHVLRGKLVCILIPTGDPRGGLVERTHECRRTDSTGTAGFQLPEGELEKVEVNLASDGLRQCFKSKSINMAEALKTGTVAPNTCDNAKADTIQPGELVLFAHQTSAWDAMKSLRNEF